MAIIALDAIGYSCLQSSCDITSLGPISRLVAGDVMTNSVDPLLELWMWSEQAMFSLGGDSGSSSIPERACPSRLAVADMFAYVMALQRCPPPVIPYSFLRMTELRSIDGGTGIMPLGLTLNRSILPGPPWYLYMAIA